MEHTPPFEDRLSEHEGLGLWRRIRQWLGERLIHRMTGEASDTVGGNDGGDPNGGTATVEEPSQETKEESDEEQIERIMAASEARYEEETKWEAGGSMGILPQLVIGPQRYPSPKMWGPENAKDPLTIDEEYGKTCRMLDKLDEQNGFDGTP